jgi:A/G-specific adenine glycosylase
VMALLREAIGPVPAAAVDAVWPDAPQLSRCVAALVADGLMIRVASGSVDEPPMYRLPG